MVLLLHAHVVSAATPDTSVSPPRTQILHLSEKLAMFISPISTYNCHDSKLDVVHYVKSAVAISIDIAQKCIDTMRLCEDLCCHN